MMNITMEDREAEGDDIDLIMSIYDKNISWLDKTWWKSKPRICVCLMVSLCCVIPFILAVIVTNVGGSDDNNNKSEAVSWTEAFSVTSTGGVAVTDNPTCSQISADILTEGGNAMDAAVAAALCLGVVSPASSGLGGGCFILGYNKSKGESTFIDSREVAPAASTEDMFVSDPLKAQWGGLAVAVPAELRGLYLAWQKNGGGVCLRLLLYSVIN
jgi:hypothetical protein